MHVADLPLIENQLLATHNLITIRQGEPVVSPLVDGIEPARCELIKIAGQHDSWTCNFFNQGENLCGIYDHRPLECRLLKCQEPADLTAVIYQHCLGRKDVVAADDELWELIELQEEHCTFAKIAALALELTEVGHERGLSEIARVVTLDLRIRQRAVQNRQLGVAEELLYFGRPLFKSLAYFQLKIEEERDGVRVQQI